MSKIRHYLHIFTPEQKISIYPARFNAMAWSMSGLILMAFLVIGCSEPVEDEVRIRQRIDDMVKATEQKELGEVMEPVEKDFLGNKRIRKANLKGLVLLHFRRHKNVHVFVNDLEVVLEGLSAKVTCNVVLAGRNQTLPEQARVLQVKSVWKKIEDDWFVVSASWRDPLLDL